MAKAGELVIQLSANVARLQQDMQRSRRVVENNSKRMESAVRTVRTAFVALGGALSVRALAGFVKGVADSADQLGKLSQRVGVSVESLSALQFAGKLSDVSMEQLSTGLRMLSKNMADMQAGTGEARIAFQALGISVTDSAGKLRSTEDMLREVADRFAGMEDGAGKTAIAMRLFGESGARLITLLNQGSAGLDKMRGEAERLGIVIGGPAAESAAQFNDNMTRLNATLDGLKLKLGTPLISALAELTQGLLDGVNAGDSFAQSLNALVNLRFFGDTPEEQIKNIRLELEKTQARLERFGKVPGLGAVLGIRESNLLSMLRAAEGAQRRMAEAGAKANAAAAPKTSAPALPNLAASKKAAEEYGNEIEMAAEMARVAQDEYNDATAEAIRLVDEQIAREKEFADAVTARNLELQNEEVRAEQEAYNAAVEESIAQMEALEDAGKQAAEELKRAFEGFGRTTSKTFADTLTSGSFTFDTLRNLARQFLNELIEMQLYRNVFGPLFNAVGGTTAGGGGAQGFGAWGGTRARGGPVSMNSAYLVGERGPELFVPNAAGEIVNDAGGGGGGVTVVQNIRIDSRTDLNQIRLAMEGARQRTEQSILASMARGGAFARAVGRA